MQRALIYLKGDLFEETETLELAGHILIQPDPGESTTRPVVRVAGPHTGIQCIASSASVTFSSLRLELDTPLRQPLHTVQVGIAMLAIRLS